MILPRTLLLASAWIALTGELSLPSIVESVAIGFACSWSAGRPSWRWLARLPQAFALLGFFVYELVLSNLRVAKVVLRGESALAPAFVAVPLDLENETAIAVLANLVTLTPGTLSVDVSSDRRVLYVHTLNGADPDAVRRDVEEGFLRRVRALFA